MLSPIVSLALLGISSVSAAPFTFPLENGFPDIKIPSPALLAIEEQAHGTLPNSPLLTSLAPEDITNWEVLASNEIFEVAFYTSLIYNITHDVAGFAISPPSEKAFALEALSAIVAQEEIHALGANAILATAGSTPILPCEYVFPSVSYETAIDLARTFTDVVLGTLQEVVLSHALYGDEGYIPLIGGVIGSEAEQVGWFRTVLGLNPSEVPFLTRSTGLWAYSVLNQLFIVPGSCPNANIIDVPILAPLAVLTAAPIEPKDQYIEFEFANTGGYSTSGFSLVYVNQQNLPIVETPKNVKVSGDVVTFEAALPYAEYLMNGLTLALVTSSAGPFASVDDVAAVTLYGPGIIEIN